MRTLKTLNGQDYQLNGRGLLVSTHRFLTKRTVRQIHSFSDMEACMGHIFRTRFPGTEINKLIVLTAFYCDTENVNRRSGLSSMKFSKFFFYILTALKTQQAYSTMPNLHHLHSYSIVYRLPWINLCCMYIGDLLCLFVFILSLKSKPTMLSIKLIKLIIQQR